MNATAKNVMQHATRLVGQLTLKESRLNAMQDVASGISPINVPSAAAEAKRFPCSSDRKNRTGPDVSGSPRIKPPIDWPHLRPTVLTIQMKIGTLTSLIARNVHEFGTMSGTDESTPRYGWAAMCNSGSYRFMIRIVLSQVFSFLEMTYDANARAAATYMVAL